MGNRDKYTSQENIFLLEIVRALFHLFIVTYKSYNTAVIWHRFILKCIQVHYDDNIIMESVSGKAYSVCEYVLNAVMSNSNNHVCFICDLYINGKALLNKDFF